MFSFHKPKIYRSNLGCCICKAKSSSSRFTDSKKYENEFERCFRIQEKRSGEICNACVLLVKRWKKLSPENRLTKHWHHVVDARAGPGAKLTGSRRMTGGSVSGGSANSLSKQHGDQDNFQRQQRSPKSEVLPLSSNQANNQASGNSGLSTGMGGRASSLSNKARAIDTNVSTFTFGEPYRRSYMTTESSYTLSGSSSSTISKPSSSLNSSAFESVIKRFRQRQQQQQLEAKRRQQNRQLRFHQSSDPKPLRRKTSCNQFNSEHKDEDTAAESSTSCQRIPPSKRLKRSSGSINTLTVEGQRVSTLLDGSIWRKEKICCGVIFRGLYNEVAVFPKLLKPCQCRLDKTLRKSTVENTTNEGNQLTRQSESPPPRATKSGSISSCDSSTSGTGSMEQPLEELAIRASDSNPATSITAIKQRRKSRLLDQVEQTAITNEQSAPAGSTPSVTTKQQTPNSKRPRAMAVLNRRQKHNCLAGDTDSITSSSSSLTNICSSDKKPVHSPASSSGASSSRLLLMAEDEDVGGLASDEVDASESSNDASSSVESLTDISHQKKSGQVGAIG